MADFGLIKSFDIDNGELDGFDRHECFVLGYELAQIDELLKLPEAFDRPIHSANVPRIKKSCADSGRHWLITWIPDDSSETWARLRVACLLNDI